MIVSCETFQPRTGADSFGEREMAGQEDVNRYLREVIAEAEVLRIPLGSIKPEVRINSRAKKRFGCCRTEKTFAGQQYEIELSQKVLACKEKKIKEILAHEILHSCGSCQNHGKKWKIYANAMNRRYGYEIRTTTTDEAMGLPMQEARCREEYKYFLRCQGCGAVLSRKRESRLTRHPECYRCAKCGGKLKII